MVFRICFPGTVILCQPENRNFPGTANFMSSKGHKFPGYDHFHANRKTKKINLTTFFFAPLGNPDRNSFPERQEIPKYLRKNWKRSYIFTT